jgi:Domain of unknown function (DUF4815)
MPQQTNLNIAPYYDDFDINKNYHKVLFKPGYPVQARELTTLQSILQNQIEQHGNFTFKEGSIVIPGQINYNNQFNAVKIENSYLGVDVGLYVNDLVGKTIKGDDSKVEAKIAYVLPANEVGNEYTTLYVSYLASGINNDQLKFSDNEKLVLEEAFTMGAISIQAGEGFSVTTTDATPVGSAVILSSGVYFLRGNFVSVTDQILILDPYSNTPSYKVGFDILEEIITSDDDSSLNDNAQGFSNYAAPGADRFKITAILSKKDLTTTNTENFISLLEVRSGNLIKNTAQNPTLNILADELARRTSDEAGDYYVSPFNVSAKESLNNNLGNNGIFQKGQLTYNNNSPREDLGTYSVSAGKAYIKGYEVNSISATFLDFEKPRTTNTNSNVNLTYFTGPTYTLNSVYGAPNLNLSSPFIVSLRNNRVGISSTVGGGKEVGLARVYDFALSSGSYSSTNPNLNLWDLSLFDIDTYSEIVLNEPITITSPVFIKGKSSGATGHLRFDVNNAGILTAYGVKGTFAVGEKFIFNGVETTSRVSTAVTAYTTKDVLSVSQVSTSSTIFTGNIVPSTNYFVGIASVTARASNGISTIFVPLSSNFNFTNNVKVEGLVGYTVPNSTVPTYSRVLQVNATSIVVTGITTVTGICEGSPPASSQNVSDLAILNSSFQSSTDNTLYTFLKKPYAKSVDLTQSNLTIKQEFAVTITNNQSNTITASTNQFFLPFTAERYTLIRSDGTFETLSSDKLVFDQTAQNLTIYGLGSNDSGARLIATLRKINVTSKVKNKTRITTLIVDKSAYAYSGIGSTTINDGLTYGSYPYGTRVQDEEISLNTADVTRLYGIFESNSTSAADLPKLTLSNLNGPTNKTGDLLVGEQFMGQTSGAIGVYVAKDNDLQIDFIYLNDKTFLETETVEFNDSGITATIATVFLSDKNITDDYIIDYSRKETIYDYSRIIRKPSAKEPVKQIKIIFEDASFSTSDTGDVTTANSYNQFDYSNIPSVDPNITDGSLSNADILDIRPVVSNYTVSSGTRSPFEFLSRTFSASTGCGRNILASNESILLSYDNYLGRIDRIFLNKNGTFQIVNGQPSESPQLPKTIDDALEIATVTLPPYLSDMRNAKVNLYDYKRYQMKDISKLETRIKNLENYTTLNLLEVNANNFKVKDTNGLDRFKSGFFVDNFTTTLSQKQVTIIKNSIDPQNTELRPAPYTSSLDLLIGSKSLVGIGQSVDPTADSKFVTDLVANNIRRTGQVITLDYTDESYIIQPYATRTENVTPFLVTKYVGAINLYPASDTWTDQVRLDAKTITVDNYTPAAAQMQAAGYDPQSGFGAIAWNSWQTTWTGVVGEQNRVQVSNKSGHKFQNYNIVETDQTRTGTQLKLSEQTTVTSLGDSVVSTELAHYMRSRNVEFTANRLRPFTRVYSFFDGQDVNNFIVPKLLEITMTSGVFQVGETVVGTFKSSATNANTTPGQTTTEIVFRVATANHKYGPFNAPTDVYVRDPYNQQNTAAFPSIYSSTSTTLNVDTSSLSAQVDGTFYGRVLTGLTLKGQTSGAQATINNVRLYADNVGTVIGSFYIPNPNVATNPSFECGTKTFRLTSSSSNSTIDGIVDSQGDVNYYASGLVNTVQEDILSVKSAVTLPTTVTDTRTIISKVPNGQPYDPLAQSFLVTDPSGIFVTKADIFVRTKDDTLPLIVQLRPMELGIPKATIYPFSEVVVDPKDINTSEDGTVATTVTFPSPIYLKGGTEHAIVLLSEANTYNVWVSQLGQTEVSTINLAQSQQIVVTEQPNLGSLFKSQNGSTWNPSQYEDLKFTIYKANFSTNPGDINFYNPKLNTGNQQVANLLTNSLTLNSRKIRVGLGTTVTDTNLTLGNTIIQGNSTATGNYVGAAGSAAGTLTLVNTGIGYSNGSYSNVSLTNVTGSGINATANITIVNNVATAATIVAGGSGYRVGDIVTISSYGGSTLGSNMRLSIPQITGINELLLDNVQGTFTTGTGSTIGFIGTGIGATNLNGTNGNVTVSSINVLSEENQGLYIKVNHKNHGMYALNNDVIISGAQSDINPTTLSVNYGASSNGDISLSDILIDSNTGLSVFSSFENVSVSSTNPGYIRVQDEIIAYTGVNGNNLTGITRQIDQTIAFTYTAGTPVFKYELDGISLRRINKKHSLQDSNITRSFDFDYYYVKIDPSSAGNTASLPYGQVNRSTSGSFNPLYINTTKSAGGPNILATQNIPFEIVRPNINTLSLTGTSISAKIQTISGSSVDGNETSYVNQGYESISLDSNNYLSSPRIVASQVNESGKLGTLPGNKSFTLNLTLSTTDANLSPVIDLERVNMIFVNNRVNSPISNYITDYRASSLKDDPSSFVYASNPIALQVPASSIKIIVSSYINQANDLRALYAIMKDPDENPIYYPFPGYNNLNNLGQVINIANNDGTSDTSILKTDNYQFASEDLNFVDYEFTMNNLPEFKYFSIKLIGTSSDMAHPPRLKDLRVIALA